MVKNELRMGRTLNVTNERKDLKHEEYNKFKIANATLTH